MENFALGTVLFVGYFCFYCWLFHAPAQAVTSGQQEEVIAHVEVRDEDADVTPLQEEVNDDEGAKETPKLSDPWEDDIDLDSLQIRQARKIAKALNIKQTVTNGGKKKDKPLDWLRREIKQKLQQNPQEVAPVIREVLAA